MRDTYLNEKLRLTEEEIVALSPMRLPPVNKPLAFAFGTAELSPLMSDSQELHALRSAEHMPGALIPVPRRQPFYYSARTARSERSVDAASAASASGALTAGPGPR